MYNVYEVVCKSNYYSVHYTLLRSNARFKYRYDMNNNMIWQQYDLNKVDLYIRMYYNNNIFLQMQLWVD